MKMACILLSFLCFLVLAAFPSFAITEAEYWKLYETAAEATLINAGNSESKEWLEVKARSFSALSELRAVAPSESLPILFKALESRSLSNRFAVATIDGIATSNCLEGIIGREIYVACGLSFGYTSSGHIAFQWMKGDLIPATSYAIFWWYEGRKYMPEIWNAWYACWKKEMSREKPRKAVAYALKSEIVSLGHNAYPFIGEAIAAGDKSLAGIFETQRAFDDFAAKAGSEVWKYRLDSPEGLEIVSKRLKENGSINENWHWDRLFSWKKSEDGYYANPNRNYWYWRLPENGEVSLSDIEKLKTNSEE